MSLGCPIRAHHTSGSRSKVWCQATAVHARFDSLPSPFIRCAAPTAAKEHPTKHAGRKTGSTCSEIFLFTDPEIRTHSVEGDWQRKTVTVNRRQLTGAIYYQFMQIDPLWDWEDTQANFEEELASWDHQFSWGDDSPGTFFLSLALQRWISMCMSLMQQHFHPVLVALPKQDFSLSFRSDDLFRAWSYTVTLSRPKGESNGEHKADLNTGGVLSTRPPLLCLEAFSQHILHAVMPIRSGRPHEAKMQEQTRTTLPKPFLHRCTSLLGSHKAAARGCNVTRTPWRGRSVNSGCGATGWPGTKCSRYA
jgi:hypothetical protein